MNGPKKSTYLIKKAIAAALGITLAFSALMLPNSVIKNELVTASADTVEIGDCTFAYSFVDRERTRTIKIDNVTFTGDTVEVPSVITHDGVEYTVSEIGNNFLNKNTNVKTVIFPDSVTYIGKDVLSGCSSLVRIVLSDDLTHVGDHFALSCGSLDYVEYNGTKITPDNMGDYVLQGCSSRSKLINEKGAVCFGNWLIEYAPHFDIKDKFRDVTEIRIADLGNNGVKIDYIMNNAVRNNKYLTTIDLEGIQLIRSNNFTDCANLTTVKNPESITEVGTDIFTGTPWLQEAAKNGIIKFGSSLIYYKTDDNVIDLTTGELEGVTNVYTGAFTDCKNVDTLRIKNSSCKLAPDIFCKEYDPYEEGRNSRDMLAEEPVYKLKEVYINGRKMTASLLQEDRDAALWIYNYGFDLTGSAFMQDLIEEKTKLLFKQMDITYYGPNNDKIGTLSPTDEFYIRLKIHNYIATHPYYDRIAVREEAVSYLIGGEFDSISAAYYTQYMLECAGVGSKTLNCQNHYWNSTKIGDEWFESDDAWDLRNNAYSYSWFGQSGSGMTKRDPKGHTCSGAYDSFHDVASEKKSDSEPAQRTLGDINGDDIRDTNDLKLLWDYVKGDLKTIDDKTADINFDGRVNLTDAVVLNDLVCGKAVDKSVFKNGGSASGVKIAFVNGADYDNIKYAYTDVNGYIVLPEDLFTAPEGKKLSYDVGEAGQKVRLTTPLTIVKTKWVDDYALGDVNADKSIDIEDAVSVIQHINGMTPLTAEEETRADVSKDGNIDIDDAVILISYINGNSTF